MNKNIPVLTSAVRTPIGSFKGALSGVSAVMLGSCVIKESLNRSKLSPADVDEVIMGMVLQGGIGQAPARQVAIHAGLPLSVSAWTVNKVCSSGLRAVMSAAQSVKCGDAKIVLAGGMENMSQTPYYLDRARSGYGYGHGTIIDGMIKDGLWIRIRIFIWGIAANFVRGSIRFPALSRTSLQRILDHKAREAIKSGKFKSEIIPVIIPNKKGDTVVDTDEEPLRVDFDKIAKLTPAFDKDGTITAANASSD